ncbi:GDSL esterase/lipase CPRD49 [Trifolium repens]|nr:GDSL esterase/lipase CPRD49 [Trifolium repens]
MTTRPQFVLFGSSIVQFNHYGEGWGATLAHLYARKADIVLRGYASWNSKRALQIVDNLFPKNSTAQQPALVIVYFGGNDSLPEHPSGLGPHVPIEEYIENMRNIAIHLKTHSKTSRLIFLSTPPVSEVRIIDNIDEFGRAKRSNETRKKYSEACLKICNELNIKAIDLWTAIQKRKGWEKDCFIDGVHFSAEGSKIVSKEILRVIKEEWETTLYWKTMPVEFGEDSPYDPVHPDGTKTINVSNDPFPKHYEWEWE